MSSEAASAFLVGLSLIIDVAPPGSLTQYCSAQMHMRMIITALHWSLFFCYVRPLWCLDFQPSRREVFCDDIRPETDDAALFVHTTFRLLNKSTFELATENPGQSALRRIIVSSTVL